jgi:Rod binding domain-containing protein
MSSSITPSSISGALLSGAAATFDVPQAKPTKAADAAQQFEALLIGQMLRSVREASQDDDDDSTGEPMLDLANQQFSQLLAKNGGFGMAHMIAQGLDKGTAKKE